MLFPFRSWLLASLAISLLLALPAGAPLAKSSSYLGMDTQTGMPSGDVRAAIANPDKVKQDRLVDPESPDTGGLNLRRPMRIGVQAAIELRNYAAFVRTTKAALEKAFGAKHVTIYYLNERDLSSAVRTQQVDFFIAEPNFYAMEESMGKVEELASYWSGSTKEPNESVSSVLFMKSIPGRAEPLPLNVIRKRDFVAADQQTVGGWFAAAGEIVKAGLLGYDRLREHTTTTSFNSAEVARRVRDNQELVGILPACEYQLLLDAGTVSPDEFVIINRRVSDALSCPHSTRTYPGLVFGAVEDIEPGMKKELTSVLFTMPEKPAGSEWTNPVSTRPIFDLFYLLKEGPYRDLAGWSFDRFLREHVEAIIVGLLLILMILTYATTLQVLVRRRTRLLRNALTECSRVEAEATESRLHIANLERTGIVGQMSTIIAHELKQPLGAITNYGNGLLRRLQRGNFDQARFEDALREIVDQAGRASQIVERVRSYAKHDFPPRKVSDLSIIIENAIQTFRRSRTTEAELVVRMHSRSMAEVDSWEIELAVHNLLKNAADAISGVSEPRIEVSLYPDDKEHTWKLIVADNGPYITDEQLDRFFKPLQTSKGEGGMGLGLSIVASIAERHAGNIIVERNGARGVKFTITLPKAERMSPETPLPPPGPETISIYEAGGNGAVVRRVLEATEEDAQEKNSRQLPRTVHSGSITEAVSVMQGGRPKRLSKDNNAGD